MLATASPAQSEPVAVCIVQAPGAVAAAHREQLTEWSAELRRLVERRKEIAFRHSSRQLERHLNSAILCAHAVIGEASAPLRSALIMELATLIAPFFPRLGDARQAALGFPAIVDLSFFLSGPDGGSLDELAANAEAATRLIERIVQGGVLWSYCPQREGQPR